MSTDHGVPSLSLRVPPPAPPAVKPARAIDVARLLFELRNVLENSQDLRAALDIVEELEQALRLRPEHGLDVTRIDTSASVLDLESLLGEALGATAGALENAGVIVLRRHGASTSILAPRYAVLGVLGNFFRLAASAVSPGEGLRILRTRIRNTAASDPELAVEYGKGFADALAQCEQDAPYVKVVHDARRSAVRFIFKRCH